MPSFRWSFVAILYFVFQAQLLWAQSTNQGHFSGSFQTDFQYYIPDSIIGVPEVDQNIGSNSFLNLNYTKGVLMAGLRYEAYQPALLGYDQRYSGNGIANRFITLKLDEVEVTAGNFYEQFGLGLSLRAYQNWSLGFDNSIDGIRVKSELIKGIRLTGLIGNQRFYFDKGVGTIRGLDADFNLNELLSPLKESLLNISLGASIVSKYQEDADPAIKLPENVASTAFRIFSSYKAFSLMAEYAYKINDPSFINNYIYKPGNALQINASYAWNTTSIAAGLKRIDNFDFRSDRDAAANDLLINYLPSITPQVSYGLATLYPYATQATGEMGLNVELSGRFSKNSFLGGSRGLRYLLNYSRISDINRNPLASRLGYESDFLKLGKTLYYESFQAEVNKKLSKKLKLIASYYYTKANNNVLRIANFKGDITAHTTVLDAAISLKPKHTLKIQAQHMATQQDRKSWAALLVEYVISPNWFFSVSDDYNYGNDEENMRVHYLRTSIGFIRKTTRFTVSYGKQRAGVVCVGGLCRLVPATSGFSATLSTSF